MHKRLNNFTDSANSHIKSWPSPVGASKTKAAKCRASAEIKDNGIIFFQISLECNLPIARNRSSNSYQQIQNKPIVSIQIWHILIAQAHKKGDILFAQSV